MLCGIEDVTMSSHNAASWGYFDSVRNRWNKNMYVSYFCLLINYLSSVSSFFYSNCLSHDVCKYVYKYVGAPVIA